MTWNGSTDVTKCVRSRWYRADKNSGGGELWLKDKTEKEQNDESWCGQDEGNLGDHNADYCNINRLYGQQVPSCFIHCAFVAVYVKGFDKSACNSWSEIRRLLNYPNPFCDLDQMRVALKHFCRIVVFLCPLYALSDGFQGFFWFLQCMVCCSHSIEQNKQLLVQTIYPPGLWWKLGGCPAFSLVLMGLYLWAVKHHLILSVSPGR